MRSTSIKSNFNTGEVSELMYGRLADFDRMKSAMVQSFNGISLIEGGWTRRPSTGFCDEVRYSLKATRLVRFKYSTTQSYAIEFGDQYVRFKKGRGPVYQTAGQLTITGISKAAPGVLTYTGTDPANGADFDLSGIVGMTELNGRRVRVANVNAGANTFELTDNAGSNIDTSGFTTYSSGGVAKLVYTLATPYLEADLFKLTFARSPDKLYIFHQDYPEATLNRFADDNWTHTPIVFIDGPYLPVNTTATTFTFSAATVGAGRTLTASSTVGINDGQGFLATDVGRLIRADTGSVWGYALITARTNATQVTVTIINPMSTVGPSTSWRMGLLSDTTGYSRAGTFFGDRLIIGGCPYRESRWDASFVGDYVNFQESSTAGETTDANAIPYTLTSEESQQIRWIRNVANGFAIGTFEGEWLARPSVNEEAMTPTNRDAKQSSDYGSEEVEAVKVGSAIMSVQKYGRRVREIAYSFADNKLVAGDATILAEHITKAATTALSGLVELAYQKERIPIMWAPRRDGQLLGMTYSQDEKVGAWHQHRLGGYSDSGHTVGAAVESVCVIPAGDGSYEELWMVVQRYIGGRVVRYNEFLHKSWEKDDDQGLAPYLDCSLSYNGSPVSTITGLHHLAGETVSVLVDGAVHPDVTVSAIGEITLNTQASKVVVGYGYNSDGEILPFDAGSADGTAQGKIQRKHHVAFRLYQALGLSVGPSFSKLTLLTFRKPSHGTNVATPLFTGIKSLDGWPGDYSTEDRICFRFNQPLPGTILSIIARQSTEDA